MACRRDTSALRALPSSSIGRSPAKAPSTSDSCSGVSSALPRVSSRNATSDPGAVGTSSTVSTGSSVVPT